MLLVFVVVGCIMVFVVVGCVEGIDSNCNYGGVVVIIVIVTIVVVTMVVGVSAFVEMSSDGKGINHCDGDYSDNGDGYVVGSCGGTDDVELW